MPDYDRQQLKQSVLRILKQHVGRDNAISAAKLFILATGETLHPFQERNKTRPIRSVIRELRMERNPIISGNAYWWAETDAEFQEFIEARLRAAARTYKLNLTLNGVCVERMAEQFQLDLQQLEAENGN